MPPPTATRKIEIIANVCVIIVSIFLSVVLAKNYLFSSSRQSPTDAMERVVSTDSTTSSHRL